MTISTLTFTDLLFYTGLGAFLLCALLIAWVLNDCSKHGKETDNERDLP